MRALWAPTLVGWSLGPLDFVPRPPHVTEKPSNIKSFWYQQISCSSFWCWDIATIQEIPKSKNLVVLTPTDLQLLFSLWRYQHTDFFVTEELPILGVRFWEDVCWQCLQIRIIMLTTHTSVCQAHCAWQKQAHFEMWIYIYSYWFYFCLGKTIYVEWWHERLKNTLNSSVREALSPAGEAAAEPFTSKPFSKTTWSFPNQHHLGKRRGHQPQLQFLLQFCWFLHYWGFRPLPNNCTAMFLIICKIGNPTHHHHHNHPDLVFIFSPGRPESRLCPASDLGRWDPHFAEQPGPWKSSFCYLLFHKLCVFRRTPNCHQTHHHH